MNRQALDKLVKKLGMQVELAPILESEGGYERFEGAVDELLKYYETHKFPPIPRRNPKENWGARIYYDGVSNSQRSFDFFRGYFGIGTKNRANLTLEGVAKEREVTKQNINQRVNPIIEALRLKVNKERIWYGSL